MDRIVVSHHRRVLAVLVASVVIIGAMTREVNASDHLDSPTVAADPRADIGDVYAWTAPDGRRLNLVMTIVGHAFSDRVTYAFHLDSGPRFGATRATIDIACRVAAPDGIDCTLGDVDAARGDASSPEGLASRDGRFRVFAGRRDDPFFNNVRGTRAMYDRVGAAIGTTASSDVAGCPRFDESQVAAIRDAWRSTDGGPAKNFLAGWSPSVIVIAVDMAAVTRGGPIVAAWASTSGPQRQIDRAARPLTGNALLETLATDDVQNAVKERWNASTPADGAAFVDALSKGVALYDGLDGRCGDGFLIDRDAPPSRRYAPLAALLADDRLWVDTASTRCRELFAVERAALGGERVLARDCGGRALHYDAVNAYRSLVAGGRTTGIDDGVHVDDAAHSRGAFPFVAAPSASR